jgi:hypothetical protein
MWEEPHAMDTNAYYYMPHFKPGVAVQWQQRRETVSHVVIRRKTLMVYLVGHETPVHPEALQLAPSAFHLSRVPSPL